MGNSTSGNPASRGSGKVILWDGSVQELKDTTTLMAAELMLEHPQQVVVELQSVLAGKRPRPLPADENLEASKVYLMLPVRRGKPASLSTEEARRVLLMASSAPRSGKTSGLHSYWGFLPLLARVCSTGLGGDGRYHRPVDPKEEEKVVAMVGQGRWLQPQFDMPEVSDGQPEYLRRQLSGKGWKPSLDTIVEKKIENRVSHWLF